MRSLRDFPGYVVVMDFFIFFLVSVTWLVALVKQKNSSRDVLTQTV